ncbi:MAG: hemerythrin family protein [Ignisphaera sp.]|nr:hemerythrin family protein [Ignisphaera sp.]
MTVPDSKNIITSNSKLDFEHAQIFATLDRLQEPGLSQAIRIAACEKLLHYISEHCVDEEDLMREYNFPGIENHFEAHRNLQTEFIKRLPQFIRQGGLVGDEIRTIFYNHIINVDLPMIAYIQSQQTDLNEMGL